MPDVGHHAGNAARHCFADNEWKALAECGRRCGDIEGPDYLRHVVAFAEQVHSTVQSEAMDQICDFRVPPIDSPTGENELNLAVVFSDHARRPQKCCVVLLRVKAADETDEHDVFTCIQLPPQGGTRP